MTVQPKTLDDLGCFYLKMFRNCPIRIEKLPEAIYLYLYCFYHGLSLYAFILLLATARGKIFGISASPW